MPRNGSGVYSLPSGSTAVPNTPIASATQNAILADLVADLNAARPVVSGGTGATTSADARTNLGISATNTPFTPAGIIAATNTQAAIEEVVTDLTAAIDGVEADLTAAISGFSVPRNRIVNSAMQISQERGTTLVDVTTDTAYVIDQVRAVLSATPGGTLRGQQQSGFTPRGAPNFVRFTAQVADASLASGDYYGFDFPIEGLDIADAQFGTANAVDVIFRAAIRTSVAGTGHFIFQNSARNRSYVVPFTISSGEVNTWVTRTAVVPGDTTGTWLTGTGIGLICGVTLASGSTFNGTASAWTGSDIRSVSGATNFMASGGITFDVSEVGLYVDHAGTGVAPPWELPDFGEELRRCCRYWFNVGHTGWATLANSTGVLPISWPVEMRTGPVVSWNPIVATNVVSFDVNTISQRGARSVTSSSAAGAAEWLGSVTANARL